MAAVIFDSCGAVAVEFDDHDISTLTGFKEECFRKDKLLLHAHMNSASFPCVVLILYLNL